MTRKRKMWTKKVPLAAIALSVLAVAALVTLGSAHPPAASAGNPSDGEAEVRADAQAFLEELQVESPVAARLSPSGEQMAFIVGDSVFVADLMGGHTRGMTSGVGFEAQAGRKQLVWSPDSRFLLFRHGQPPHMDFAVVEVETGEVMSVLPDSLAGRVRTVGNAFTGPPVWSPSADGIAFLAGRPDQFGPLEVVYLARRRADGRWFVQPVVSDGLEKTAVAWSTQHLAWASRERDGRTHVAIARIMGDTIGAGVRVATGNARITTLIPNQVGSRLLVSRAGWPPHVIDMAASPRILPTDLPRETRVDSYVGWIGDGSLLTFRYPSDWRSELVSVDDVTGETLRTVATGGMLADGTIALATRGLRVVFAEEDGSHPRSYRSLFIALGGDMIEEGSATPPRFAPGEDPWTSRIVGWRTGHGTALEAQLLTPSSATSPPTVIVPYGGYRNTALSTTYFIDILLRELMMAGWQVIRPNTSAANVLAQRSGYGAVQLSDTHDLIDALAEQGVLDPSRVAVVGHSHGASLAYYYATHSTAFCAIVAVNGRTDWVMQAQHQYDGLLPGPLGASPDDDPALYATASPLPNAQAVTAPLLLVAGADDAQILPVNATAMADSLRAYSRPFDLLFFDDEGHMIEADANRNEFIHRSQATLEACR